MPFSSSQNMALLILPKISASLSIISACYCIYRFILVEKNKRKFTDRLVFVMMLFEAIGTWAYFLGSWASASIDAGGFSHFCTFQGWLIQIKTITVFYNCILAVNYLMYIKYRIDVSQYEKYIHFAACLYPTVTSFVLIGLNGYTSAGPWCWVSSKPTYFRMLFFYVPLWVIMALSFYCMSALCYYIYHEERSLQKANSRKKNNSTTNPDSRVSIRYNRQKDSKAVKKQEKKERKSFEKTKRIALQVVLYTAAFLLTWLFGTINRILQFANPQGPPIFIIVCLMAITIPLQGFLNFLVYMLPRFMIFFSKQKYSSSDSSSPNTTLRSTTHGTAKHNNNIQNTIKSINLAIPYEEKGGVYQGPMPDESVVIMENIIELQDCELDMLHHELEEKLEEV